MSGNFLCTLELEGHTPHYSTPQNIPYQTVNNIVTLQLVEAERFMTQNLRIKKYSQTVAVPNHMWVL